MPMPVEVGSQPTPAELRVVAAIAEWGTEAEVARRLGLSVHTVKQHLRNLRARLGVNTTAQVIARLL